MGDFLKYMELFTDFLLVERGYSKHTVEAYERDVNQFFDYCNSITGRSLTPEEVDKRRLRDYLGVLSEIGLEDSSISRKLAAIKSFYKFLLTHGYISKNPAGRIRSPKKSKKLPVVLSETEITRLLDSLEASGFIESRNKAIMELLYSTGMRLGELVGVKYGDIDLRRQLVKVFGKGAKERIVPVGKKATESVSNYLKYRIAKFGFPGYEEPLFVSSRGRQLSRRMVQLIAKKYLEMVSEKGKLSPHVLRHTFATHLLDNGADIDSVKELLGHKNLATTQIYTHVSVGHLKEVYRQAHPHAEE